MRGLRGSVRAVLAAAALLCYCSTAAALQQVQIILSMAGPCYPVADELVVQVIGQALNPLTSVPWGNPQQSGGYVGVCNKAGVQGCGSSAASRRLRRLHQDTTASCPRKWYLYLDTTQPEGLAGWDPQAITNSVKAIVASGQLLSSLRTALGNPDITTLSLRYISTVEVVAPSPSLSPPPSSDSDGGSDGGGAVAPPVDGSPPSPSGDGSGGGSAGGGSNGSPPDNSTGFWKSRKMVIVFAIGGGVVAAVLAGLVSAVIFRRKSWVTSKAKVTEDLEAFRAQRAASRPWAPPARSFELPATTLAHIRTVRAGSPRWRATAVPAPIGGAVAGIPSAALPAAKKGSGGGGSGVLPTTVQIAAAAELEGGGNGAGMERQAVLDGGQARSAPPGGPPAEGRGGFLGRLFGRG